MVLRGGTREEGIFIAPLIPGTTLIRIAAPPAFTLAAPEPYPVPITMAAGQPDSIRVVLAETATPPGKIESLAPGHRGPPRR